MTECGSKNIKDCLNCTYPDCINDSPSLMEFEKERPSPGAVYQREWRARNPGKATEYHRKWREKHPDYDRIWMRGKRARQEAAPV